MSGRGFLFTLLISVQTLIIISSRGRKGRKGRKIDPGQTVQSNGSESREETDQSFNFFFFFSLLLISFPFSLPFVIPRKSFLSIEHFSKIEKGRKRKVREREKESK